MTVFMSFTSTVDGTLAPVVFSARVCHYDLS